MAVSRSIDGLVMVLLGGVQSQFGTLAGAALYTWLSDVVARHTDYWRAAIGVVMLILVLILPQGIAGLPRLIGRKARMRHGAA
jgi:branched-chain amino acid transport system permease protein